MMATSRPPSPREAKILGTALARQMESFENDPDAARDLLALGDSAVRKGIRQTQLAAYAMTAGMILNLDETVTKQ